MKTMRAVVVRHPGDESSLCVERIVEPELKPGCVRIDVAAAGVNRADLLQRRGLYPPPPGASEILGLECAGTVIELGEGVENVREGDRVMALLTGGGYAEQVVAPFETTMKVPEELTDIEAGGTPEVFLTAFLNLFMLGRLPRGGRALIHGGSGGVGTAAIQLVRAAGAQALVTAGSAERCERCRVLGATEAWNHRSDDWLEGIRESTGGLGVDTILDCIGAAYLERHLEALATGGRLVVIGLQGGRRADLDLALVMRKRLQIVGSTLRARPAGEKGRIIAAFERQFGAELASGAIRTIVHSSLPFERAEEAHRLLAAGEAFGKIVLTAR
jgi:putative PIG3 family NAD(P)H quinone oxidoreductase